MNPRPISDWLDKTGVSITEDEFFLKFKDFPGLYEKAIQLYQKSESDLAESKAPAKKFEMPVEQLSPKGLALMSYIYSEEDGSEVQPLVASTVDSFCRLIKLVAAAPVGARVTVIFQPTDRDNLGDVWGPKWATVHKSGCRLERTDAGVQFIHMDSTPNPDYQMICEMLVENTLEGNDATRSLELEKYTEEHPINPRGYTFQGIELPADQPLQDALDKLSWKLKNSIPLLIRHGENVWLYGNKPNQEKALEPTLMKSAKPELYKKIPFPKEHIEKFQVKVPKEVYQDAQAMGHQQQKLEPFSSQQDDYSCGTFLMKYARELNRDQNFMADAAITPLKGLSGKAIPGKFRYKKPAVYYKAVQSQQFSDEILKTHGTKVVTSKGKTLQQTHTNHQVSGYIVHFNQKYHDRVKKFLDKNKDNPAKIRACVESYDAGKISQVEFNARYARAAVPAKKENVKEQKGTLKP